MYPTSKSLLLLLFGLVSYTWANAQNQVLVDSLLQVLETNISDKEKVDVYVKIATEYRNSDSTKTYQYVNQAIQLADEINYAEGKIDALYAIGQLNLSKGNHKEAEAIFNQMTREADQYKYPKGKADGYNGLGLIYWYQQNSYEKTLDAYLKALKMYEEIDDKKGMAGCHKNIGIIYHHQRNYEKALDAYLKSVKVYESFKIKGEMGDKKGLTDSYNNMGVIYAYQGNYEKALGAYFEVLKLREEIDDKKGMGDSFNNIGIIYGHQGNYEKALEVYFKALKIRQEIDDEKGMAASFNNIGRIYDREGNYEKALDAYLTSLKICETFGNQRGMSMSYNNIGGVHYKKDNYEKALEYNLKALEIAKAIGHKDLISSASIYSGQVYQKQKQWRPAQDYLKEGLQLAQETGHKEEIKVSAELLAQVEKELGNYQAAYTYHVLFKAMADSLQNEEQTREITRLEMNYEFEQEKDSLEFANARQRISLEKDIERGRVFKVWASLAILLLASFITVLILFLRARNRANRQLKALDETKSRFFANVSHELRTPLTLLSAPLKQVLADTSQIWHANNQQLLAIAQENTHQLKAYVNDILDLSRLENSQLQLETSQVQLGDLIKRIFANYDTLAQHQLIEYNLEMDSSLEVIWVSLDAKKFEKVLNNLISNAIKFTPSKGWVEVAASKENAQLVMKVSDTGSGIDPKDLPHIFDRFSQSRQPNQLMQGGSGIGLAIVKEYTQLLQGKVSVSSELNKGSTFTLKLPIREVAAPPIIAEVEDANLSLEDQALILQNGSGALVENKEFTVLIVEDHPQMQQYIRNLLQTDYRTLVAYNGLNALEIIENEPVDLIVSDVMMPQMDGFALVEKLKNSEAYHHIPIILLTALGDEAHRIKGLMLGVNEYLAKPFSPQELTIRAQNLLTRSWKIQQEVNQAEENTASPNENQASSVQLKQVDLEWLEGVKQTIKEELQNEAFLITDLAEQFFLSERQFRRKIKLLTGLSPKQLQHEVALQIARDLLERGQYQTIKEVAYHVGMQNAARFSKLYEARFGKRPTEYFG